MMMWSFHLCIRGMFSRSEYKIMDDRFETFSFITLSIKITGFNFIFYQQHCLVGLTVTTAGSLDRVGIKNFIPGISY